MLLFGHRRGCPDNESESLLSLTTLAASNVCHEVIENREVASDCFLLSFEDPQFAPLVRPGQFLMVSFPHLLEPLLPRPFALFDVHDDTIQILYRKVGKGTGLLSEARKGDSLRFLGPLGNGFSLPGPGTKPLVLAGGIGIASVHLLLAHLLQDGLQPTLLYGTRRAQELLALDNMKGQGLDLQVATEDGGEGFKGSLAGLFDSLCNQSQDFLETYDMAYVCGPPAMVKTFALRFAALGISTQVSLETRMACGFGVCQGCAIPRSPGKNPSAPVYSKVCSDGPVFAAEDVLWDSL